MGPVMPAVSDASRNIASIAPAATGAAAPRAAAATTIGLDAASLDVAGLASATAVAFRSHPHLNNVLTHLCGADWGRLDAALRALLDPAARPSALSPFALNLLDLMWAERGVTGRIMKPCFHALLATLLAPAERAAVAERIGALFRRAQQWRRI